MIRNVIFDWSGTLVDDLPAVWQATNHIFLQAGLPEFSLARFRAEFCLPFKDFYDRHTPDIPMEQLEVWFHGRFKEVQNEVVELPHARKFLEFCRSSGRRTFLLSTIHRSHYATQSVVTGFDRFLDHPYIEIHDKRLKIRDILREHQLDPRETIFIGDMQHDIETAKHGGVFSCAVLTGYNSLTQLRASKPDLLVEHLGELQALFTSGNWQMPSDAENQTPLAKHPVVTVGAAIFNARNEVLMIQTQKWSGLWGIPGGKTHYMESSLDALRREIKEETNLEVDQIEFVMVQDCLASTEFYRPAHFVLLNYSCKVQGAQIVQLNEEAQVFQWLPLSDALRIELNQPTRILLEELTKSHHGYN